jgi:hypothetical protein
MMRRLAILLAVAFALSAGSGRAQVVGTMSELMIKIIYPTSDAVFYISTRTPTTEAEWGELQGKTLTLAESANILMMPAHMRDEKQWIADAKLLREAGAAAYKAAMKKDVPALEALSDQLYESCTSCHMHYRPNYGRRPPAAAAPAAPGR